MSSFFCYKSLKFGLKVSPRFRSPVRSPKVSHFWRCCEEPWLNDSGTA